VAAASAASASVAVAVAEQLDRTSRIIAASADPADMRRRMGAAALQLDGASDPARSARWRAVVASRLPDQRWPARDLRVVAVDAADGSPVVFDRDNGIELADAVAASCASGAPHRACGRSFIDGGYRRNENADLAVGSERVLVLSPFGGRTRHPIEWRMQLAAQADDLRAAGSTVEVVGPDEEAARLIGANAMDPSLRPGAARAGFAQGVGLADRLGAFWG
ncbi:patatin, partial [Leucobacter sp. Ag1]|uniref:patatin-like phospholipase family protein n=2 Tax=Leucobacter TaxID=55968 RepID=UPI000622166B